MTHRFGTLALVGKPNVGKSTLLNTLVGQKIAIATPKPQTTQVALQGVVTIADRLQVLLIDTPGLGHGNHPLKKFMNQHIFSTLEEVDMVLWLIDGRDITPYPQDEQVARQLNQGSKPIIMVLNKSDLCKDTDTLLANYTALLKQPPLACCVISAKKNKGVQAFINTLEQALPEGPPMYDEDTITSLTFKQISAELIREAVMQCVDDELPYSVAITIEGFDERNPELTSIKAMINVERMAQKPIIIGKNATMIKKIGTKARKEIEALLETKVFLDLQVKVKENWRKDIGFLKELGITGKA